MLKLSDLISFLFTTAFIAGTVLLIALLVRKYSALIDATKSSLEKRGWKVSSHGMSVPVGKPTLYDRERYLDATQRGLSRAAHASTFGRSPRLAEQRLSSSSSRDPVGKWSGQAASVEVEEHRHHRLHLFKH